MAPSFVSAFQTTNFVESVESGLSSFSQCVALLSEYFPRFQSQRLEYLEAYGGYVERNFNFGLLAGAMLLPTHACCLSIDVPQHSDKKNPSTQRHMSYLAGGTYACAPYAHLFPYEDVHPYPAYPSALPALPETPIWSHLAPPYPCTPEYLEAAERIAAEDARARATPDVNTTVEPSAAEATTAETAKDKNGDGTKPEAAAVEETGGAPGTEVKAQPAPEGKASVFEAYLAADTAAREAAAIHSELAAKAAALEYQCLLETSLSPYGFESEVHAARAAADAAYAASHLPPLYY